MSAKCKICSESGRLTHRISNQHHRRPSIGSWYWFISGQQIMFSCAVRGTNPLHHYPSISSTNHCMMQRDSKQQQKLQINKPPLSSAPILFPLPAPSSNSSSSSAPCGQPGSRAQPVHRQLTTHLSPLFLALHFFCSLLPVIQPLPSCVWVDETGMCWFFFSAAVGELSFCGRCWPVQHGGVAVPVSLYSSVVLWVGGGGGVVCV